MSSDSDKGPVPKIGPASKPPYIQTCIVMTILSLSFLSEASALPKSQNYLSTLVAAVAFILVILLTEYKGRKLLFMTLFILSILSSTAYLIDDLNEIGFVAQTAVRAATVALTGVVLCEYCEPRHRMIHLVTNAGILRISYWVNFYNAAENEDFLIYLEYSKILLGLVGVGSVLMWPESPYWLASRKRLEESKEAFLSVRRKDLNATAEMQAMRTQEQSSCFKMIYAPMLMGIPIVFAMSFNNQTMESCFLLNISRHSTHPIWIYLAVNVFVIAGYIFLALKLTRRSVILLPSITTVLVCVLIFLFDYILAFPGTTDNIIPKLAFPIIYVLATCAFASINYPFALEVIPCKYISIISAVLGLSHLVADLAPLDDFIKILALLCGLANPITLWFLLPEAKDISMVVIEKAYRPKGTTGPTNL